MGKVRRIYVEKRPQFAVRAKELSEEIKSYLGLTAVTDVRVLVRYDIESISEATYQKALGTVFSEPPVDILYETGCPAKTGDAVFSVEYLPGQFDQRADSAEQCVKLLAEGEEPIIRTATTYILSGELTEEALERVKAYCINPVDSRETGETIPETLVTVFETPADVRVLDGFAVMTEEALRALYESLGLAMTFRDFQFIQNYYNTDAHRDPTMTEIRVLDTYWSDHCRHTTFLTELTDISIEDGFYQQPIAAALDAYKSDRVELYGADTKKCVSLMDIALMGMKKLRAEGKLADMEVSEEINACSIIVPVEVTANEGETRTEEWLVFFKNETHNHPTEIEPFGGAATCLGGAIRDPLSGRGYVYQAMRVTGAADPTLPLDQTLSGKLPQRKLTTGAAKGYSSYGNQIGLATGLVDEIYHPNYVAKRMEIGAVMGAAPRKNVRREKSEPGDVIILMGGRTGRDGCGGATGSSKAHTETSIETCGAEVQKGNAPTERKLQRLFRRAEVSRLIKKCNDFGAGGVSVAIGELADGLRISLDKVPKKYAGLDGTELAISESQERMAIVVDQRDVKQMLAYASEENLEAVVVAEVTEEPRLVMEWRGKEIVNIARAFLDTNGARQEARAVIAVPEAADSYLKTGKAYPAAKAGRGYTAGYFSEAADDKAADGDAIAARWLSMLADLNVCAKKGLGEQFDGSIGAATAMMPYGGRYQLTPVQTMAAKLPVMDGDSKMATLMSYGFNPYLSAWSPFHGAVYAVVSSVAKIVAAGGAYQNIRFTFQEYFRRLGADPKRWGEPAAALLGAYDAQKKLSLPSIGGKDSMSGSFSDIDVPPTLVSFAVDTADVTTLLSPELKQAGNVLVRFSFDRDQYELPNYAQLTALYDLLHTLICEKKLVSAYALSANGIAEAVSKMAFGNLCGVVLEEQLTEDELFLPDFGAIIAEVPAAVYAEVAERTGLLAARFEADASCFCKKVGTVSEASELVYRGTRLPLRTALSAWLGTLEEVFPTLSAQGRALAAAEAEVPDVKTAAFDRPVRLAANRVAKPRVFIPVFPGTNCEYDSTAAFIRAGAQVETVVFRNLDAAQIQESVEAFAKAIDRAQMIMFPGGFSAGDEPDGSGKFIATAFRNPRLTEAVHELLQKRDGLVLGICNGFQALVKLGLVLHGEIRPQQADSPTLAMNTIGRHVSKYVYTKVVSNRSPWLLQAELGKAYCIPASHGEGRFVADETWLARLREQGQIATQYVDLSGTPTMREEWNPNGSYLAIEGITSPDGRVLGKMAHSERRADFVAGNIYGEKDQKIMESGVAYFQ